LKRLPRSSITVRFIFRVYVAKNSSQQLSID